LRLFAVVRALFFPLLWMYFFNRASNASNILYAAAAAVCPALALDLAHMYGHAAHEVGASARAARVRCVERSYAALTFKKKE